MKLGFGCASIAGKYGESQSIRALSFAYERGVRHFDIARSYGWGEAEKILGKFLKTRKREEYTITTKCGLVPKKSSLLLRTVKSIGRNIITTLPTSQNLARQIASQTIQPSMSFSLSVLEESFNTSLKELGIDYIDILLVHGFSKSCENINDVLGLFQKLSKQGKLGKYGVSIESDCLEDGMTLIDRQFMTDNFVIQTPCQLTPLNIKVVYPNLFFIFHSPFRTVSNINLALQEMKKADLGINSSFDMIRLIFQNNRQILSPKFLVCSMFNTSHITENIDALNSDDLPRETVRAGIDILLSMKQKKY